MNRIVRCLSLLAVGLASILPVHAVPVHRDVPWCGTNRFGLVISDALHRQHERRLARERTALGARDAKATAPKASRNGNIAVVADDGNLIVSSELFNLAGRGLQFTSSARGVHVAAAAGDFDSDIGSQVTLADDDSVAVTFASGFTFPFFGHTYSSVYLNSDGNLTFEEPEAQSDRELPTFLSGPPRIAPFFTDLDPSAAYAGGGVFLFTSADKVVVTWLGVPTSGTHNTDTFQVTLTRDGGIHFAYQTEHTLEALIGISPGRGTKLDLLDYNTELPATTRKVAVAERFSHLAYVDEARIGQAFFAHFADIYDHLLVFADFPVDLGGGFSYEVSAQNEVKGLGLDTFDYSSFFGSRGRLSAFVMMSSLSHFPDDPDQTFLGTNTTMDVLAQEAGHRWLAHLQFRDANGDTSDALLGRDLAHWSFKHNTSASDMEGNEIRDNGDGSFVTTAATERYSPLDQYAMGLIPASAVPPFFYVADGSADDIIPGRAPEIGVTFTGTRYDVTIDDVIAVEGERQPSSDTAPKSFRMAFVLLEPPGTKASRASLAKLDRIRRRWESYFHTATDLHATVNTRLRER